MDVGLQGGAFLSAKDSVLGICEITKYLHKFNFSFIPFYAFLSLLYIETPMNIVLSINEFFVNKVLVH